MNAATLGLSFVAGSLSTLSPCVLPIVPILLATAVGAHRLGPFALAGGLALSFTLLGVALASAGSVIGLDVAVLRDAGAVLLIAFGLVLLSARVQRRFATAAAGVPGAGNRLLSGLRTDSLAGQFVLGLVLGITWSPCVGPTLGAAITLASQGRDLGQVALAMAFFGVGAALPMMALGFASRQGIARMRGRLLAAGQAGKAVLGAVMIALGVLVLSGADKRLEAWTLDHSPQWLVRLTTAV